MYCISYFFLCFCIFTATVTGSCCQHLACLSPLTSPSWQRFHIPTCCRRNIFAYMLISHHIQIHIFYVYLIYLSCLNIQIYVLYFPHPNMLPVVYIYICLFPTVFKFVFSTFIFCIYIHIYILHFPYPNMFPMDYDYNRNLRPLRARFLFGDPAVQLFEYVDLDA